MTAEELTLAALTGSSAVAALVGSGDQLRVYPDEADQGQRLKPYVVFERAATQHIPYLDFSPSADKVSIQVTCWADSRTAAGQIARAVEDAMREGWHLMTDGPADYVPELREYAESRFFDVWEGVT